MKKWLRIVGGIAILGLVLSRTDFRGLTVRLTGGVMLGLAAVTACLFAAQALSAYRWKVILGPDAPPWAFLFRLYLIATFFSLFLPTAVGGDAVRAVAATRAGSGAGRAVGSVLLDRLLGVVALVVYLLIGLIVAGPAELAGLGTGARVGLREIAIAAGVVVLSIFVGWVLRRRIAAIDRAVSQIRDLVVDLAREPGRFGYALLVGLGVQALYILAWLTLGLALELPIPPSSHLISVPIVSLGTMIPITLAGVGLREGAWTLLLARFGISAADAVAYSLLYFACWMVMAGSGGLAFSFKGMDRPSRDQAPIPSRNSGRANL